MQFFLPLFLYLDIKGYSRFEVLHGFVEADGVWRRQDFDTIQLRLHQICAWYEEKNNGLVFYI